VFVNRVDGCMIGAESEGGNENQVEMQVDLFTRDRDLIVVLIPPNPVSSISERATCSKERKQKRELSINQPPKSRGRCEVA